MNWQTLAALAALWVVFGRKKAAAPSDNSNLGPTYPQQPAAPGDFSADWNGPASQPGYGVMQ